jgi:hypothetical protein
MDGLILSTKKKMTSILPNLTLKIERRKSETTNNTNTNTNTLTNTIIVNPIREPVIDIEPEEQRIIPTVSTPDSIKTFKEYLLSTLISYFKSEIILANNIIELSPNIVLKIDDLKKLIVILVCDNDDSRVNITTSIASIACCKFLSCCAKLPLYRKVDDIIIDKKYSFKNRYDQYYTQMTIEFNISLDYVLL